MSLVQIKTVIVVTLFSLNIKLAIGQSGNTLSLLKEKSTRFVESENDFYINSNLVPNSFVNDFYFGRHIKSDEIERIADNLKKINRIGGMTSIGIGYYDSSSKLNKSHGLSYFFTINYKEFLHASFSSDLFKIIFQGNSDFNGKQADLSDFYYQQLIYQQLKGGVMKKINDNLSFGLGVAVINGQKNMQIATRDTYLFTAEDGEYIDLNADYSFRETDTKLHQNLFANNGFGLAGDLYLVYSGEKSSASFNMVDFGFINWSGISTNFRVDTLVRFEAYSVSNIFDLQDTVALNYSPSNITNELTKPDNPKYRSYLPSLFSFMYVRRWETINIQIGGKYFLNARHYPQTYIQLNKSLSNHIAIGGILSYGGYGNLDAGLEISYKISEMFQLKMGSRHVDGLVFPSKTSGEGAYVQIRKLF